MNLGFIYFLSGLDVGHGSLRGHAFNFPWEVGLAMARPNAQAQTEDLEATIYMLVCGYLINSLKNLNL